MKHALADFEHDVVEQRVSMRTRKSFANKYCQCFKAARIFFRGEALEQQVREGENILLGEILQGVKGVHQICIDPSPESLRPGCIVGKETSQAFPDRPIVICRYGGKNRLRRYVVDQGVCRIVAHIIFELEQKSDHLFLVDYADAWKLTAYPIN